MIRVIDALEAASLVNKQRDASYGSLLGLAMALTAMSTEGATHIKAHVANMHTKLVTRLEEEEEDMLYVEVGVFISSLCSSLKDSKHELVIFKQKT